MSGKVYYDDTCKICSAGARKLSKDSSIKMLPISKSAPHGIEKKRLLYEIHAIDERGTMYAGVDALIKILEWHPRYKMLAPLVALPLMKHIVALLYWLVARIRHFVWT